MKRKSFKQKQNTYRKMIGFSPDAIVLISGGNIKEIGKNGTIKYRSTKVDEGDAYGILWGEARILAIAELAVYFPQSSIIITSAPSSDEITTVPAIYKELERPSIIKERIILEKKSTNTLLQIGEAVKIIHEKKMKKIVFITNEYHIPRVRAIYKNFESLTSPDKKTKLIMQKIKCSGTRIKFVAAEFILPYRNKKFIKIINHMKENPAYQNRIQNEKRGLLMIKSGEYGLEKTVSTNKSERIA